MPTTSTLLPPGFYDILPPHAAGESKLVSKLLKQFSLWGYEQVKPPMVEYEQGMDVALSSKSFCLTDPESSQMMVVRTDMTMQIARMAALRLKEEPRPLRLSYAGQVLRATGEGLYADRQLTQVGTELIGSNLPAADAESVILAITALEQLKLKGLSVDFSLPGLSQTITGKPLPKTILQAIEHKDTGAIMASGLEQAELLVSAIQAAGSAYKALNTLKELNLPDAGKTLVSQLEQVIQAITAIRDDITITIDPLERKGFEYHDRTGFSFFMQGNTQELGRGGRYAITMNQEDAVGFTFDINTIQRALPKVVAKEKIYVPLGENAAIARKDSTTALQGLKAVKDPAKEAARMGCSSYINNGKITPVKA